MSKANNQATLMCVNEEHEIPGLFVEEGRHYEVRKDHYGLFIEDNNGDEFHLDDFDWETIFMTIN